jgi:hypothetical protein
MALPPENRTPRMVMLETIVARTPREKLMDFPVLESADHQLIGALIQEFNYMDFNLRRAIIDQPEENLDPKSVFDELVALFIAAKAKRQVIMVTHNANLVINTDADQIIVAAAGPHPSGGLPPITYAAGGLESAEIRRAVCDILEGGEAAFRERARRLRVRLER